MKLSYWIAGIDTSAITAAIYEGVSTKTYDERVENQLVRQYARSQGWEIREFAEEETGKHASRAAYRQLFKAARLTAFVRVPQSELDAIQKMIATPPARTPRRRREHVLRADDRKTRWRA
jgi:Resolvase, N terminal domain